MKVKRDEEEKKMLEEHKDADQEEDNVDAALFDPPERDSFPPIPGHLDAF